MVAAKKWDLTPEARDRRRADADELSQQNSKDRDRLRHAQARLAEVKELIKETDLGQELEELKDEVKFLESGIDARSERIEKLLQEAAMGQTSEPQDALPGVDTSKPPKAPKPASKGKAPAKKARGRKAESRPSEPSKGAPPAPPPCPPPPATGHPQRVLRGWVYERVAHAGALPLETLQAESPGYHEEYITGTVSLLLACDCMMERAGLLRALELSSTAGLDRAVLGAVVKILIDAPLTSAQIARAMETPHVIVWDVLTELRDTGRVELRGDLWHLTYGAAEEEAA